MAYKTFLNGYPLPASELNTYLMGQVVATFANASERSAAITSPQEGQVTYLEDQNKHYYYNGSAWTELVTAGVTDVAGKNKIINGAFDFWQRGTSFSNPVSGAYTSDRFYISHDGTGATRTISQQTFSPGTAPVSGYEGQYFFRYATTAVGTGNTYQNLEQKIEDVRTFAGQTITLSFWAKADSARTMAVFMAQNFGSGGSATVYSSQTSLNLTTAWQRFTATYTLASISGKTIGSGSSLIAGFILPTISASLAVDIWGVQLEAGSVATPFSRAAGTLQGELAACQRYYWRTSAAATGNNFPFYALSVATSSTSAKAIFKNPVPMRVNPNSVDFSTISLADTVNTPTSVTSITIDSPTPAVTTLTCNVSSGLTQFRNYFVMTNGSSSGFIGLSAEL